MEFIEHVEHLALQLGQVATPVLKKPFEKIKIHLNYKIIKYKLNNKIYNLKGIHMWVLLFYFQRKSSSL